jgi:hypothetical protein
VTSARPGDEPGDERRGRDDDPELFTEPIEGWRLWVLRRRRSGELVLTPAGMGTGVWPTGEPIHATCRVRPPIATVARGLIGLHRSPDPRCTCGVYASASLHALIDATPSFPAAPVIGTVAMWGRVVEHERGWRAEYAYPSRLRLVCAACLQGDGTFGEPAQVLRLNSTLYPLCEDHAARARGALPEGTAEAVRSELLGTYGVDLLPLESNHELVERSGGIERGLPGISFGRGPAPPPTPIGYAARRIGRGLGRALSSFGSFLAVAWVAMWTLLQLALLCFVIWTVFTGLMTALGLRDTGGETAPSAPVSVSPSPVGASEPTAVPAGVGGPPFIGTQTTMTDYVCARLEGHRAIGLSCTSPEGEAAPLKGFATTGSTACPTGSVAVTRRPAYTICWVAAPSSVPRRLDSPNPFSNDVRA